MSAGIYRCLRSIVGQMSDDTEIIVVDDGSTDDSSLVVSKFVDTDARIHLIRQQKSGVSTARNAGIVAAQGSYLLFIDADDEIEYDYLQNIKSRAKNIGADMLVWGLKRCFSDGRIDEWKPKIEGTFCRKDFLSLFPSYQYREQTGLYGFVPNKLIKKEIVDRFGLRFNPDLIIQEDFDFFLDCYAHSETIHCFGETGYRYNISNGINKPTNRAVSYPQLIDVQNKCVNLLKKEGAWTSDNKRRLFLVIGNLSLSMILENRRATRSMVESQMDYIWESPYCIPAIQALDSRRKGLKHLILKRNVLGTLVYARLWRAYLFLRTGGRS